MTPTEELERLAASIKPGPWKWWTSNSYKRLMQDIGRNSRPVIEPYVCRDGCPDISISQALMTAIALLPELLAEVIATRRASGHRVNESVLHTLWTMGNCRLSFDAFKARVLSALEPATTNQNYADPVSSVPATSESAEPVAWQYRYRPTGTPEWSDWADGQAPDLRGADYETQERPLYTHSQPLTVEAAAQVLLEHTKDGFQGHPAWAKAIQAYTHRNGKVRPVALFEAWQAALRALAAQKGG